jgi:hypothetical protein
MLEPPQQPRSVFGAAGGKGADLGAFEAAVRHRAIVKRGHVWPTCEGKRDHPNMILGATNVEPEQSLGFSILEQQLAAPPLQLRSSLIARQQAMYSALDELTDTFRRHAVRYHSPRTRSTAPFTFS